MMTGLVLPYILGLYVISFSISMSLLLFFCLLFFNKKKKKKIGEKMRNFIFFLITFSDIACVFA
jgi:hypothetical protein